jgi:hypothetical protein
MEIELDLDNLEPINIDFGEPTSQRSVNFGSGIELLMNDKNRGSNHSTTIDMKDLDNLESELNDLSSGIDPSQMSSSGETKTFGGFSNFFGGSKKSGDENIKIITEDDVTDSHIGQATADSMSGNTKTWDGYSKVNEVPPRTGGFSSASSNMTDREKRRKKRTMIRNLEEWYDKGIIKTAPHFNMDSNYEEVEDEYEGAMEDKRKRNAVKLQQNWMITAINTIEYGNAMFNPFDISLDGWGESVSEDIDSYDEIFEQLHEKYKGGKMSPELALLLKLGFSASVIHFSNKSLSTATPGYQDVMRQSPELMRMFTNATVDSMKQQSPGMAFASELLNNNRPGPSTGAPPVPVETRNQSAPPASSRPGMQFTMNGPPNNRPDLAMGRGAMFQESGVDMNTGYQTSNNLQPTSMPPPQPSNVPSQQRTEMSGPKMTDIDNILSGLKTKNVDIHQAPNPEFNENDSMISISSLKDLQNSTMPKRTNRRKPKSDRNVISLDI